MSYAWLPKVLAEIAEVAGVEAALDLAAMRGGEHVYIPASVTDDHWLVLACGRKAADAICSHFAVGNAGSSIDLPRGMNSRKRRKVDQMLAERKPVAEIARASGFTMRGVWKRKAKQRGRDRRQGNLFT